MLRANDDGETPSGGSPGKGSRSNFLLQEVLRGDSGQVVSGILADKGFDDIPSTGIIVLVAVNVSGRAAGGRAADGLAGALGVTRRLGVTETDAIQMIDTLALRGYLELRAEPDAPDLKTAAITDRGRALLRATLNAAQAARWADLPLREGDIVVSTWPKTGTTWVQTICALLVFQTPELPAPLSQLSVWLEMDGSPRDELYAQLAAQPHRRIIKTHLPLSDIPIDPCAFYIAVGRHPLDTAISHFYHEDPEAKRADDTNPGTESHSARKELLRRIGIESSPPRPEYFQDYFAAMLLNLSAAWALRDEPNVMLIHYEDLSADLEGEMRRVAARLGITVPEATWPDLVRAATFDDMRAHADQFVPSGGRDNTAFFRSGSSGEGRALLTSEEIARYRDRVAPLAPSDMLAWLHRDDEHA